MKFILVLFYFISTFCYLTARDDEYVNSSIHGLVHVINDNKPFRTKFRLCVDNENCLANGRCNRKRNDVCLSKVANGGYCVLNSQCLLNHCDGYRCKGVQIGMKDVELNGSCISDKDCRFEQYCKGKKCKDRIKNGWCWNDSQCLSNHCRLLRCKSYFGF